MCSLNATVATQMSRDCRPINRFPVVSFVNAKRRAMFISLKAFTNCLCLDNPLFDRIKWGLFHKRVTKRRPTRQTDNALSNGTMDSWG